MNATLGAADGFGAAVTGANGFDVMVGGVQFNKAPGVIGRPPPVYPPPAKLPPAKKESGEALVVEAYSGPLEPLPKLNGLLPTCRAVSQ